MRLRRALYALAPTLALAACASDWDPARVAAARARESALRAAEMGAAGARARAALPTCLDGPVPERPLPAGSPRATQRARRVEGTFDTQFMSVEMTDNLCPVQNPCCAEVSPRPHILLDAGAPDEPSDDRPGVGRRVQIPIGAASALFRNPRRGGPLSQCDLHAYLQGFGSPRLRLTWYPFVPGLPSSEYLELCEVRAAQAHP